MILALFALPFVMLLAGLVAVPFLVRVMVLAAEAPRDAIPADGWALSLDEALDSVGEVEALSLGWTAVWGGASRWLPTMDRPIQVPAPRASGTYRRKAGKGTVVLRSMGYGWRPIAA